ncbi:MAG TPA: dual specificity protein phosphatase family protein [Thermomicrobiales bacterium]|nr:dual specificity protein phosphatase family protein [Thermomicrobiales bacterium]
MERFYWLIPNVLAGCSRPGGRGHWWRGDDRIDEDLASLRAQGIGALLTLTEEGLPDQALERHELIGLHIPIVDLQPPTPDEFRLALAFIDEQRAQGQRVAVHCLMGQGRAGSVLAAYLIRGGMTADDALAELRSAPARSKMRPRRKRWRRLPKNAVG